MFDLSNLEWKQVKPFDIRRERRALYRLWKKFPTSKAAKREVGLQSERKYMAFVTADFYDAADFREHLV